MPSTIPSIEGTAVQRDAIPASPPSVSPVGTARYNPRMLGGGSVVPYVGSWTGERMRPTRVIERPGGGGIGFADETILDRDEWGVLWTRFAGRVGAGKPLFQKLHPVRQRRAMRRLLCQVCTEPADSTDDGTLWLVPGGEVGNSAGWPEGAATIHPPLCSSCARLSVRMCPALRQHYLALRARSRLHGVNGVHFRAGHPHPQPASSDSDEYAVSFDDPVIRWVMATQLVRTLHDCTAVDLERLS
ncbi:MAG TPA: hypothetical protein VFW65_02615 [Pseudonocardiaceae bacterium]|nr:hypothetical protein [Pseudonocardiaceae bacterium]